MSVEKLLDIDINGDPYAICYIEHYTEVIAYWDLMIGLYRVVDGGVHELNYLTRTNLASPLWVPPGETEPRPAQWYIDDVVTRANAEIEEIWGTIENPTPPTPEEIARREIVDAVKAAISVSYDDNGKPVTSLV